MKKINEADSRMLDGGRALVGQEAKDAGNLPNGYRYYAYCEHHKVGRFTNIPFAWQVFCAVHRFN